MRNFPLKPRHPIFPKENPQIHATIQLVARCRVGRSFIYPEGPSNQTPTDNFGLMDFLALLRIRADVFRKFRVWCYVSTGAVVKGQTEFVCLRLKKYNLFSDKLCEKLYELQRVLRGKWECNVPQSTPTWHGLAIFVRKFLIKTFHINKYKVFYSGSSLSHVIECCLLESSSVMGPSDNKRNTYV